MFYTNWRRARTNFFLAAASHLPRLPTAERPTARPNFCRDGFAGIAPRRWAECSRFLDVVLEGGDGGYVDGQSIDNSSNCTLLDASGRTRIISATSMPLAPGTRLGPYEILCVLGTGGMGEVWKARDTRLNRLVAIKASVGPFSERFEREARAIAAVNHPHVCSLYDVGPDYLVMEYVEGQWLYGPVPLAQALAMDLVPGKPFSSDNFLSLMTDSVGGVDGLYQLGIEKTPIDAVVPALLHPSGRQERLDRYRAGRV